jgi:hypothetical protein
LNEIGDEEVKAMVTCRLVAGAAMCLLLFLSTSAQQKPPNKPAVASLPQVVVSSNPQRGRVAQLAEQLTLNQ